MGVFSSFVSEVVFGGLALPLMASPCYIQFGFKEVNMGNVSNVACKLGMFKMGTPQGFCFEFLS
jgi:hypothetical protein